MRALAKLEQVLPDRLRRRVNAVHSNVSSMRWGGDSPTVDADALGRARARVSRQRASALRLSPARRRRGATPRRAAQSRFGRPALVSRRLGRAPRRLAHVPPRPARRAAARRRAVPAARSSRPRMPAAFVAASIASMPVPFEATIVATGPAADVRSVDPVRRRDSRGDRRRNVPRARSAPRSRSWLVTVVALLATEFDIVVEEPADLLPDVKNLGARLRAVATRSTK